MPWEIVHSKYRGVKGMLGKAFERFIEKAPVAVMVRGVLERVLSPDALNAIYERSAVTQYTRELMFSSVVGLMNLVVCRIQPSIHAAYQDNQEERQRHRSHRSTTNSMESIRRHPGRW